MQRYIHPLQLFCALDAAIFIYTKHTDDGLRSALITGYNYQAPLYIYGLYGAIQMLLLLLLFLGSSSKSRRRKY